MMTANTCIPPVDAPESIVEIGKLTYHSAREVMVRFLCQSGIQVVMDTGMQNSQNITQNQDLSTFLIFIIPP